MSASKIALTGAYAWQAANKLVYSATSDLAQRNQVRTRRHRHTVGMDHVSIDLEWRASINDTEMVDLVNSYGGQSEVGWWTRIQPHSLGWVAARSEGSLIGFVNVAWDGSDHAFLLDTKVHPDYRRSGLGTRIVNMAVAEAKRAGCEWIEVDFDDADGLAPFYFDACGFRPTNAGLIHLFDV